IRGAFGGAIVGTVQARGKPGTEASETGGKYESRKFKFVERVNYAEMRDFVVYIEGPLEIKTPPPTKPVTVVSQKDATFKPHVLPIMVGTTVEWPNEDDIFHNAFSVSDAKPFDLGLYKKDAKPIKFDKVGRVDVFCSIHSGMHCII